jgi:undecaprenyl-diphosphatase
MATPVTAGAALFEIRQLVAGEVVADVSIGALVVGMFAAFVAGALAIGGLLRYLRSSSLELFVWYRLGLAAVVVVVWLAR